MKDAAGATVGAILPLGVGGWGMLNWRENLCTEMFYNVLANIAVNLAILVFLGVLSLIFAFVGAHIQEKFIKHKKKWHHGFLMRLKPE